MNPYLAAMGYPDPVQQQIPQKQQITKVNGENGAQAFRMAPDSSVLLLDETAPIVWLCKTDGAGYKTIAPFSIAPYEPEPPVDVKALESRISRIEEMIQNASYKSNTSGNGQSHNNQSTKGSQQSKPN